MPISTAQHLTQFAEGLDPAFFERLVEGAGLAVFICEINGKVLAFNSLGRQLADHGPDDAERLHDLLPPGRRHLLEESLQSLLRAGEQIEFRCGLPGPHGDMCEFAIWLTPIPDEHHRVARVAVWFHDITARLQLRRSMRTQERLAALGTLSGSVAHHYNNLLCCVATSVEHALNMNTMTAMRRVLRRAAEAAGRATDLTHQLLAFAQADYRAGDLADLTEIVLGHFDDFEPRLAEHDIRLDLEWEPLPTVAMPQDHFRIVLANLTRNAMEAMDEGGGVLTVKLGRRDEDHASLVIADTGKGISAADMERLFEPFFTTKGDFAVGPGRRPGMGLAVAHGLVNEMRGSISASSVPTGGARFEIILPLDQVD